MAQKFIKKPVIIQAMQLTGNALVDHAVYQWIHDEGGKPETSTDGDFALLIPTLEGTMRAETGDWIIKGIQGEFYPCKPDIFRASYSPFD